MNKVSVVIPNYNGKDLLGANLPSVLKAKGNNANQILEIIVVDDGSTDESIRFISESFPQVKLIKHKEHRWFSAAVNTGVRMSKGELICLLNTDVKVKEDFLEMALPHFDDSKVFGVSLHEKGFGWSKGKFQDGFIVHSPGKEDGETRETFWLSGGSSVLRRKVWMELGGMDENLLSPFYWEDIDLSYRAAKRDYKLLWEPSAQVLHEHEATIKKIDKRKINLIWQRNQLLFIWKNLTSPPLFRKHLEGLVRRTLAHPGYLRIILSALTKIFVVLPRRRREAKESIVSDEAIFAKF